jgi:hypothetical protein
MFGHHPSERANQLKLTRIAMNPSGDRGGFSDVSDTESEKQYQAECETMKQAGRAIRAAPGYVRRRNVLTSPLQSHIQWLKAAVGRPASVP